MKIFFCNILILLSVFSSLAQANDQQLSAHEYAARTHENIIEIIQTQNQLFEENPDLFTKLISDAFSPIVDFKRIARNVMGKYSKQASSEQMQAFSEAFENSLLNTYSSTLVEFKDEKINVLSPDTPQISKKKTRVNIEIVTSSSTYPGRYSMYLDKEGNWKIINIEVNGMNLGKIFRNQFYSLMEKNQEDIDLVIEKWVASV
ncbi:MAG: ABC transporter substrate-binding protein [SAR86 cluster bacterium]|jgi:phospholipid transport system substrate-binding protein|nr:ABC transporter substrate-binding protein [SAR86 cluster bacterium]